MAKIYSTEITSEKIQSDNPIHQRLLKAYFIAESFVKGDVLEIGCGEGRGIDQLMSKSVSFTAIDKIDEVVEKLKQKYPEGKFIAGNLPPLKNLIDSSYDRVFSFQVIEHIEDDLFYLQEIWRVLRPGGIALITTPNRSMSLSRNPWHIREYLPTELAALANRVFTKVEVKGIQGNEKVMEYRERNKKSVNRIMKWDFLDLQHKLPASLLKIPYEYLNRRNRNKLKDESDQLVMSITHDDYQLTDNPENALDLLLIVEK